MSADLLKPPAAVGEASAWMVQHTDGVTPFSMIRTPHGYVVHIHGHLPKESLQLVVLTLAAALKVQP